MRIDAHHHLWSYNEEQYDWIDDSMAKLRHDFLPKELSRVLDDNNIDGSVVVQARQSLEETNWLLELSNHNEQIKGVVGWIDLTAEDLEDQLTRYKKHKKLVGFRHVIQAETDPHFMRNPEFINGLSLLAKHDFTFDLLIFTCQLEESIRMLNQVPELRVVIDHIAKPDLIAHKNFTDWQHGIKQLASNPTTHCKLSGMVTEADWQNWSANDFNQYLDYCFKVFGEGRLMFGSDWPVCLVAAEYSEVKAIIENFLSSFSALQQEKIFGRNAMNFYQLN